jgi:hypothetical protein
MRLITLRDQHIGYVARAGHFNSFGLDVLAFLVSMDRSLQCHLPVLGNDFDVVSVSGQGLVINHRLSDLLHDFAIRQGVLCLIRRGLGFGAITLVDFGIVRGLREARGDGKTQKQPRNYQGPLQYMRHIYSFVTTSTLLGTQGAILSAGSTVVQPQKVPVIDVMEALKRSLDDGELVKGAPRPGKKAAGRRKAA